MILSFHFRRRLQFAGNARDKLLELEPEVLRHRKLLKEQEEKLEEIVDDSAATDDCDVIGESIEKLKVAATSGGGSKLLEDFRCWKLKKIKK